MRIIVRNRKTGAIEYDEVINANGSTHELVLSHEGVNLRIIGVPYEPEVELAVVGEGRIVVQPISDRQIQVGRS